MKQLIAQTMCRCFGCHYMPNKTGWSTPHGVVPPKTAGKATHALQCSWISMTAWFSARNAAITSSVGRSLEDYSSKTQQRSWTTMAARWQHNCLWQEPCMDVSMIELSKRRTLKSKNREEDNGKPPQLFSLDMIPIDGCFEDVLQLGPLFFDVNCRLPPVIDGCFKYVLQQWPLFFIVDCRLPSDGSHWPAVFRNGRIPEEEDMPNVEKCYATTPSFIP